jgi:GT2 family glycosyltransferase
MNRKVTAVVVTFNRLESLKKVLSALQLQTSPLSEIIVVDNRSTDSTADYLKQLENQGTQNTKYPFQNIYHDKNEGGAGGFFLGMQKAYDRDADLIWVMDDDCIPTPTALEKLVSAFEVLETKDGKAPGFVCSNVRWKDGGICEMNVPTARWDWTRHYAPEAPYCLAESCSFVSALINARYLPEIGYPVREFFIWFDDIEFTMRLAQKHASYVALDSHVLHELADNRGVSFSLLSESNLWKYRYGARNEAAVLAAKPLGFLRVLNLLSRRAKEMRAGKVPLRLQIAIARSALSGLFFDYPSKIVFPTARK